MKIGFNPQAAAQAQNTRGPQAQTTPPAPQGSDDGVTITLSQAAQSILNNGGPGKSGDCGEPAGQDAEAFGSVHLILRQFLFLLGARTVLP